VETVATRKIAQAFTVPDYLSALRLPWLSNQRHPPSSTNFRSSSSLIRAVGPYNPQPRLTGTEQS